MFEATIQIEGTITLYLGEDSFQKAASLLPHIGDEVLIKRLNVDGDTKFIALREFEIMNIQRRKT